MSNTLKALRALSPDALADRGIEQLMRDRIELGETRDEAFATMDRIRASAGDRDLTNSQREDFNAADQTCRDAGRMFEQVDSLVRDGEHAARAETGAQTGHVDRSEYGEAQPLTRSQTFTGYARSRRLVSDDDRELDLGRYLRGLATGNWKDAEAERRAMSEGVLAGGGYMVPVALSAQVIDLARNQARVTQAGARIVPMETQTVHVARWEGDPTAQWHSEADVISPTDATLGRVELKAKALTSITKASRELLEDADNIEAELRQAFAAQFALTLDKAGLYGSGTDPEPRGVKNTSGVTTTALDTDGRTPTWDDLIDASGALADVNEAASAFIYAPRTDRKLAKQKDASTGQYIQPPAYLSAIPRLSTNQVPTDLDQGTSTGVASDIFTGDFNQLLIGLRTALQITVLTERYADTGELGFLAWWRGDVAVARAGAFHVSTGAL